MSSTSTLTSPGRRLQPSETGAPAILAEGLRQTFGDVVALDDLDLEVQPGTVFGLLGPNGAGKTTLVRILATLLRPSAGRASVLGRDVAAEPLAVRRLIGLAGQFAAVDEELTGRENVEMIGRLYRLSRAQARTRAGELLDRFGLAEAADRRVSTYSGGMRRRLDLCASLAGRPPVLLLDEPTTGLDPRSRQELWKIVEELRRDGTTVLLSTQYLEEADRLAQRIGVVDHGRLVAEGTVAELKAILGTQVLLVSLTDPRRAAEAAVALADLAAGAHQFLDAAPADRPFSDAASADRPFFDAPSAERPLIDAATADRVIVDLAAGEVRLAVADPDASAQAVRQLDARGLSIARIELAQPSLDDVFLTLTGRRAEDQPTAPAAEETDEREAA